MKASSNKDIFSIFFFTEMQNCPVSQTLKTFCEAFFSVAEQLNFIEYRSRIQKTKPKMTQKLVVLGYCLKIYALFTIELNPF